MRSVGRILGACLVAGLVTLTPRAEPVVSAQAQSGVAGERAPARGRVTESTAAIMAREEDPGDRAAGANLTLPAGAAFTAIRFADTSTLPPDGSGAAGPTQFIAIANGRLRSFVKSGAADGVLNVKTTTFFATVKGSGTPFGGRIRFDALSGRWFITMATDAVPGRVVIASSGSATITAATVWSFSSFDDTFLSSDCTTDAPSLGVDASALYIGANQFCTTGTTFRGSSAWVVRKSSVLDGGTPVVTAFHDLTAGSSGAGLYAPQGVSNDDLAAATGYFLGVDNATLGTLMLRRVSSPGGTPTISANIAIPVAATAVPIPVRHKGNTGGANGYLAATDDRLGSIRLRAGRAWIAHTIGVTDTGAAGNSRDAVRWYEIGSLDTTPAVIQSGTLNATTAPGGVDERNYWNASIATSALGRTVIGFSAAGSSEFVNAGVADREAGDAAGTLRAPTLFTSSTSAYNPPEDAGSAVGRRWGGYSETVMDPCDGVTIWSLQQFVDTTNSYGLQVARVLLGAPPTPVSVVPSSVLTGLASVDVVVTGTPATADAAFFQSPAGFACRTGASIAGVTVNTVTVNSPTSVTINLSTLNATGGAKALTITNPDGQSVTVNGLFSVLAGPAMAIETPVAGTVGQPLLVRGWAIDGAGARGTGVDLVQVYVTPAGGAPTLLGTATYGTARSDIAQRYGAQFVNSGFSLRAPSVLTPGAYTLTVYAHSTVTGTFDARVVALTLAGPVAPFGSLDTPAANAAVSGEMGVTGWALDDGGVATVDIYRAAVTGEPGGQVLLGTATLVRGARPDLQAQYPAYPDSDAAGWGLMVLTNLLPGGGTGPFTIYAYATDYSGLRTLIGTRQISGVNSTSSLPFGTIDTPGQGQTVSGVVVNFGWALAALGRTIPIDGLTIDVYVDNVMVGHPVYNNPRADIAAFFPGLANSGGPVGYYMLDTRLLADGVHTIAWSIRDDAGQATGVGSRFFRVQNGS